jgi:glycosyltransferase involved in cell wall biosynthesis
VRIIQATGFYYPDSSGGTEAYVRSLIKELKIHEIDSIVAAPSSAELLPVKYNFDGVEVFRYPVPDKWHSEEIQGRKQPRGFEVFEDWLRAQRADIYHQHSWTTGCGAWHLWAAKRLGLKTVVTAHVPGNVCMRGTMLLHGNTACDGKIVPKRCACCWLQAKGMPRLAARYLSKISQRLGHLLSLPRVGPALAADALAVNRKNELQQMAAAADRIVAVCGWLYEALLANDVPPEKLVLNRQGIGHAIKTEPRGRKSKNPDAVRFGFLGRWDRVKGVDVLVEAFKRVPEGLSVELHVCATATGAGSEKYRRDVERLSACDRRIQFVPAKEREEVGAFLSGIDVLAVPSQWLETGPLVVLEAFAAGTPVLGSDLGGIKELVRQGYNGVLVAHNDVNAWTSAMVQLATDHAFLQRMRQEIRPVRTSSEVARDMAALYRVITHTMHQIA